MAREINLTSKEWCNIIFEGKNKEYGAYTLRNESSKRHFLSFGTVAFFALLVFSLPLLSKALGIKATDKDPEGIVTLVDVRLQKPDIPKENILKVEQPVEKIPIKNSIKFTAPKIEEDNKVKDEDEMKSQDDLTNTKVTIASATVTNGDDVNGVSIDDLDRNRILVQDDSPVEIFDVVEIMPSFPGGESDLFQFLSKNIRYPVVCQENNIQGKVVIQFVVGRDGSIEDVQVAKGTDRNLDAEAMRVVKSMPKWIPGKQGGRAVRVKYYVPVNFKLSN